MSATTHDVNLILKARDEASSKLNKLSGTIKGLAYGIAGYFSVRAIGGFLKSSVDAFMEAEKGARGLSDALQSIGQSGSIEGLEAYAKEIQKVTTYEDDAVLASMKLGVTIGGLSGRDLTAATTAAIGLSKAFNIDLESAMKLVGKAATGNFGAFKKLGITFAEGTTDAQKYAEVLERGAAGFRIAQGETDTFGGLLKQLGNAWRDAKEGVGEYISESARLKGVFQVITFGLANIVDVSKWAWANMTAHVKQYQESLAQKVGVPLGVSLGELWASLVSKEYRNYAAKGDKDWQSDVDYFRGQMVGNSKIPMMTENSDKMSELIAKKWAEMTGGQFGFDPAAAVAGAGMGNVAEKAMKGISRTGFSLFESRTAGGTSMRAETPEVRRLDRIIQLQAQQVELLREKQRRPDNPKQTLLLTNFR